MRLKLEFRTTGQKYRVVSWLSIPAMLAIWSIVTESGLVGPLYFPSPSEVGLAILDVGPTLLIHVLYTLGRVLVGFLLGAFAGITLGLLMTYNDFVFAALKNIIESWRPVPPVALLPFFLLWFGFSELGKTLLVSFGCALIVVVNTVEAVNNVRPIFIRAALSLGATKKKLFSTVIFRAILPELKSGLRIAMAGSFTLVVVSEFMGADYGIGYLINLAKVTFSTQTILLGIFLLGTLAWLLDFGIQGLIDHFTKWSEKSRDAVA